MKTAQRLWSTAVLGVGVLAATHPALADNYPSRPVTLVVPFNPGGPTDVVGRMIAKGLSDALNQTFVVENRPGAGGTIGAASVARAEPDGYTLLYGSTSTLAISPAVYKSLSYKPTSFTPVGMVLMGKQILVANPDIPASNLAELIAYTKSNPGKINYSSAGNGTPGHLGTELLKSQTGLEAQHIPYNGGAPSLTAALSGEVAFTLDVVPTALPHVKSGTLKAIAVPSAERASVLPEVPTIAESGFKIDVDMWSGIVGPANLPQEVTQKLNEAVRQVVNTPQFREQLAKLGSGPNNMTSQEFGRYIAHESDKWAAVARTANVTQD